MSLQQTAGMPRSQEIPAERQSLSAKLLPKAVQDLLRHEKENKWAGFVEESYLKCKHARAPFEQQWHLNIAFYNGRQYVAPLTVAGQGFRLTVPKAPPWRVRLVINKVRTAVRTECSKLTSSRPLPSVIPATTEDEDFAAARVAEQILRSEFNTPDFDATIRSFVWWGVITGNSFIKSYWDGSAVDSMSQQPPQPNPVPGLPPIPAPVVKGKIKYERVNPFHIFVPDLLAEDIEKQPYVIHVSTRSPLWVENTFGFKPNPDSMTSDTTLDAVVLNPLTTKQTLDSVVVKEMWLKPGSHPDFPQGGVITVINNKVRQVAESWPWPFEEYPFYKYNGIPTGGFYTESVVTDLIPLQKEYNRTRSQMVEIKNTMGKPKLVYQQGSLNPRMISSEPGQAIPYKMGFDKPTELRASEIPSSMVNEVATLTGEFDDISGQHEITRGNTPNSQITSGTAISFLQEQDDSKLSYQVAGIEHAVQKLGSHYLKYAAKFWTDERLVRIVGRDGDFEAKHWRGSDLRGNTDVRVQSGSALPFSKAARQALITEFMQNGWLEPQAGMEILELGGFEKVMEDFLVDKRQAQRENMKMAEAPVEVIAPLVEPPVGIDGQPLTMPDPKNPMKDIPAQQLSTGQLIPWQPQSPMPVNSWDNHEAHEHFHNQFRKSQQFELLPEPIKKMFELHVQGHQMARMMPQMGSAGVVANNEQLALEEQAQQEQMPPGGGEEEAPPQEGPTEVGPSQ